MRESLRPRACTFLRQHYLDQVLGSAALPRDTLSLYLNGWLPNESENKSPQLARQAR